MNNIAFGPIYPRPNYPNWQTKLIRPAIQAYRDKCYEEIAFLLAPDDTFSAEQLNDFSVTLRHKLEQMETRSNVIKRILQHSPHYPYKYRDINAIDAFQEWFLQLAPFTSSDETNKLNHHNLCNDDGCLRYRCLFHTTNAEASIRVYRNDFDVIRHPETGMLKEVAILIPRSA